MSKRTRNTLLALTLSFAPVAAYAQDDTGTTTTDTTTTDDTVTDPVDDATDAATDTANDAANATQNATNEVTERNNFDLGWLGLLGLAGLAGLRRPSPTVVVPDNTTRR